MPTSIPQAVATTPEEHRLLSLQKSLSQQQIALPLSLLVFTVSALLSAILPHPNIKQISDEYLTVMTPKSTLIGFYWIVLVVLILGQIVLLAVGSVANAEILVKGVGLRLSLVNLLMAGWILAFVLKAFVIAQVLLILVILLVGSMWATLLWYPASLRRPLDFTFIHMPIRMFGAILLQVDFWQGGLLALRYYRHPDGTKHPGWESQHSAHSWIMFALIILVALINATEVFVLTDWVWATSCVYLIVALLLESEGKPPQVSTQPRSCQGNTGN